METWQVKKICSSWSDCQQSVGCVTDAHQKVKPNKINGAHRRKTMIGQRDFKMTMKSGRPIFRRCAQPAAPPPTATWTCPGQSPPISDICHSFYTYSFIKYQVRVLPPPSSKLWLSSPPRRHLHQHHLNLRLFALHNAVKTPRKYRFRVTDIALRS